MRNLPYRIIKYIATILLIILAVSQTAFFTSFAQEWPSAPELDGEAVVLMEPNTNAVIYQKNADQEMYPASTTKILTAIIVLENCSMDEIVTFTQECVDLEEGAVTIDSQAGEQMSVKDVLYGLLLPSGNDCAMALALHVAGSVSAFADMMNAKAKEIGAGSSNFVNPSGLYNSRHYTTASDLALIAQYAFQNSTFLDIISHATYVIGPTNMTSESRVLTNTHEMIVPGSADYSSDVIGGKTGYLYESGRCLVTYAQRDGMTLLAVILDGSYYGIFAETQELLDYGWNHFSIVNVSESEHRFSYADEEAKVALDASSQILTLNQVPFRDLDAEIHYAYYLDEAEYAQAKQDAGIGEGDSRQLYAWIDYSYAGYHLGSCNVYIDPDMTTSKASFVQVIYINPWLILLICIAIILLSIFVIRMAKRLGRRQASRVPGSKRSRNRRQVRYYSRSDSVDLRNQYVRSGNQDRESIHQLDDIGVHRRRTRSAVMNEVNMPRQSSQEAQRLQRNIKAREEQYFKAPREKEPKQRDAEGNYDFEEGRSSRQRRSAADVGHSSRENMRRRKAPIPGKSYSFEARGTKNTGKKSRSLREDDSNLFDEY